MSQGSSALALAVEGVSIGYGRSRPVVDALNLDVRAGETFGLIGLNGAGKTTLIKALLGLRPVDAGRVGIFGHDSTDAAARKRLVFLPERFDPPWFLSGAEFIGFVLNLYRRKPVAAELDAAADRFGLAREALTRRVRTYSKGMRQKLGLMACVLSGCDLMILDEPMSGLDPLARDAVRRVLAECKASGRTVFMSSHILSDLDTLCDRVAVLHQGRILYTGVPAGLREGSADLEQGFLRCIEKSSTA